MNAKLDDDIDGSMLCEYLKTESKEWMEVFSSSKLDEIVIKELRTTKSDRNAKSRRSNLFASYHTMYCRHGICWLLQENKKLRSIILSSQYVYNLYARDLNLILNFIITISKWTSEALWIIS